MKEQQRKVLGERHHLNSPNISIFSSVPTLSAERARLKEPVNWWGKGRWHSTRPWMAISPHSRIKDSHSKLSISSRKVLSQPAAELPFPPAPCQSKKWAKDLHNFPPSTPSTVIFIYFKINVRGMSELWVAQGAEKLRTFSRLRLEKDRERLDLILHIPISFLRC